MMRKRQLRFWTAASVLALVPLALSGFWICQQPRQVLLSDVQQSEKILVHWYTMDRYGAPQLHSYEIDGSLKEDFSRTFSENVGLDYFRAKATITPTIEVSFVGADRKRSGPYLIRYAQGFGRCPSMESLRQIASKGRALSDRESHSAFYKRRHQWPGLLSFDYVLPVEPSENDPLRDALFHPPAPDPRLRTKWAGHTRPIEAVAFSPDSTLLASGSWDATVKLWDVASGEALTTLTGHEAGVGTIAFSPDGRLLASAGNDSTIRLWDVAAGQNIRTFSAAHEHIIGLVAFSPDGQTLASANGDSTIQLWNVETGTQLSTLSDTGRVSSMRFSQDGKTLAVARSHDSVKYWDVTTGAHTAKVVLKITGQSMAISADLSLVASAGRDYRIHLWNLHNGNNTATFIARSGGVNSARALEFNPDTTILAAGGNGYRFLTLWDVAREERLAIFGAEGRRVSCIAFSRDGKHLATGSHSDNFLRLWDLERIKQDRN